MKNDLEITVETKELAHYVCKRLCVLKDRVRDSNALDCAKLEKNGILFELGEIVETMIKHQKDAITKE